MQNRYEHRNRRKYNLKVHIVLVTKYRKALLRHGIDDFVKRARLRKEKAAPPTLQEEWVSAATVNYELLHRRYSASSQGISSRIP